MNDKELESFYKKIAVEASTGCWVWTGAPSKHGCGRLFINGTSMYSHRAAWEHFIGPIAANHRVLVTCGNRMCVNPMHLESIGVREMLERSPTSSLSVRAARGNVCLHGHEMTEENTYTDPYGKVICRTCRRQSSGKYSKKLSARRKEQREHPQGV